jgi:hypothetical protein
MNDVSFVRRFWHSLAGGKTRHGSPAATRGREGYSFWQRFWASLTGVNLPVLQGRSATMAATTVPAPEAVPAPEVPTAWRSGSGWFRLPLVPESAPLLAAGGNQVVSETTSADGRVALFVRAPSGSSAGYRL